MGKMKSPIRGIVPLNGLPASYQDVPETIKIANMVSRLERHQPIVYIQIISNFQDKPTERREALEKLKFSVSLT